MPQCSSDPTTGSTEEVKQASGSEPSPDATSSRQSDEQAIDISRVLPPEVKAKAERLGARAAAGECDIYDVIQRLEDTVQ